MMGVQVMIQMVGVIIAALIVAIQLGWIFLVIVPISFICTIFIVINIRPLYFQSRNVFGELTNKIRENILGSARSENFSYPR